MIKITFVKKYTSSYVNEDLLYQAMPDFDLIYWVYASKSQTDGTLVYTGYMQRPFQFNLAILIAKNLAFAGHTSWYEFN